MAIGICIKMEFVRPVSRAFQMAELFTITVRVKCSMASKKLMAIGITLGQTMVQW